MEFPVDRLYSEHHLWVKVGGREALIGLSGYAKEELGEVDYVEVPVAGQTITKGEPFGIVETSKAVTDLVAPITGTVLQPNSALTVSPMLLMDDPYEQGWLIKVEMVSENDLQELLKPEEYERLLGGTSEQWGKDQTS